MVAGRIVKQLSPRYYQIDLSGRMYTAEMAAQKTGDPYGPGDTVYVRVMAKSGGKALLQIVFPDFPDVVSPKREDFVKLAHAAGWPEDEAALSMVAALVARRLPLRSEIAESLYRRLKAQPAPTPDLAGTLLIDILEPKS
ncbi:MAG: hypothetical protein A3G34_13410 [Candidatus Lindowbacteria bacterium RIFCSPLOWO2_12_FULL_62_27]|nr:MAG: hypothetical protein A3I06_11045 [Candidatus Lindowbacteria bacterium RIFCSPLOWO2_02_FULL_62_12]OGH62580.1 MAG: hypothetical protein A3G34_13410 [Candidatus Lindowbacteria bacterium RIFCSPLOWO2_12_FULL_62_27]